jgi:hypothetical protein
VMATSTNANFAIRDFRLLMPHLLIRSLSRLES